MNFENLGFLENMEGSKVSLMDGVEDGTWFSRASSSLSSSLLVSDNTEVALCLLGGFEGFSEILFKDCERLRGRVGLLSSEINVQLI